MSSVVVTGVGFATSIGTGVDSVLQNLRELNHGFVCKHLAGEDLGPELVCGHVEGFETNSFESQDWQFPGMEHLNAATLRSLPPHGPYALVALEEALAMAQIPRSTLKNNDRIGLFCASGGSFRMLRHHLDAMEKDDWHRAAPMGIVRSVSGTLNFNLATHYGIQGANCGFVSACTSSSHAVGYAYDEIALGRQDQILVVAAEDGNAESILPFLGLRALSNQKDPDQACRPFDVKRDGFVATGGGAALILESASHAKHRNVQPLAEMLGWGQACDGYHVAAPHPEGDGVRRAMENCLAYANRKVEEVDWVNAHATSTPAGDRAEALALRAMGFDQTEISSTKSLTGHGLSFAGALEAAICTICMDRSMLPGTAGLNEVDPVCEGLQLPTQSQDKPLNLVLNNSSGFGGSNVCHLFSKPNQITQ